MNAGTLRDAVAAEVAAAAATLPDRQREVLDLREGRALSYQEIGSKMGIEQTAVAALLARARLAFRDQLRGVPGEQRGCQQPDRALGALARRQDREPAASGEEDWLLEHLSACPACERAHAAMLEASACYRAGSPDQ